MKSFKDIVKANVEAMVASDLSSKVLFNDTVSLLKGYKIDDVKGSIKGLIDDAKTVLEGNYSSNFNNRVYKVIKLAGAWYDKKLFTKHEALYMYNIELGLKVLSTLEEMEVDTKPIKNSLNRIKYNDIVSYNDIFETKLKDIMKEYNLSDVDGKIVKLEGSIKALWALMTEEQKVSFKDYINTL